MIPLYRRVLGDRFVELPPSVQQLHRTEGSRTWHGRADVRRGRHPLARLVASVFGLPPDGMAQPLTVAFTTHADGSETWDRRFGARRFLSIQRDAGHGLVAETIGVSTLLLKPEVTDGALTLSLAGARLLGIRVPLILCPRVRTRESEVAGAYRFEVEAHLPLVGLLVHYQGTLSPAEREL